MFVDYATVLPDTGACPGRLPLTADQLERGRALAAQLRDTTATAVRDFGPLLVRAADVTRGHDVCSADPWVNGFTFPETPLNFGPLAYHPTARAMSDRAGRRRRPSPVSRAAAVTRAPRPRA